MAKKKIIKLLTDEQYEAIIEEATIDCYDEEEEIVGFCTLIQDNIKFPFVATIVGEAVEVLGVDCNGREVKAKCRRNGKSYEVNILDLEYEAEFKGWEYIEAYRR